jgi:hypothetical protein
MEVAWRFLMNTWSGWLFSGSRAGTGRARRSARQAGVLQRPCQGAAAHTGPMITTSAVNADQD